MPLLTTECSLLRQKLPMLFNSLDNRKIDPSHGASPHGYLDPLQTVSWSIQPFLHSTRMWPTQAQTNKQTTLYATSVAIGRMSYELCQCSAANKITEYICKIILTSYDSASMIAVQMPHTLSIRSHRDKVRPSFISSTYTYTTSAKLLNFLV